MYKPNIVIAEDNPGDIHLVQLALEMHGVTAQIRIVERGDEAFALISEIGATVPCPDLILMDLNLPGRSGIELLQTLRASEPGARVPVIVMTSSRSPAHRKEAEQIGISQFFNKPSDLEEFLDLGALVKTVLAAEGKTLS